MRAAFSSLFALCLITPSHAVQTELELMGVGITSCSQFGQIYMHDPDQTERVYFAWALGYLSGINLQRHADALPTKNLSGWSQDEQKRFLREWCKKHPLANYEGGVLEMLKALPMIEQEKNR